MQVASIRLSNYKAFETTDVLPLGPITVLVGPNNAGKSALIRALLLLQQFQYLPPIADDVRTGAPHTEVHLELRDVHNVAGWQDLEADNATLTIHLPPGAQAVTAQLELPQGTREQVGQLPGSEPGHFIVPFLGKRKVVQYAEDVRRQYALQVGPNLQHLAAKLMRVVDTDFAGYPIYAEASRDLVGHVIRPISSTNGFRPGIYIDENQTHPIYIEAMGEGVAHVVGLLADLVLSKGKLFLIEELESDLHPRALKQLLRMIVEASSENQFVVSTHSNIVLRYLGARSDTKVYYVEARPGARLPTSTIRPVSSDPLERIEVLRDLGYELADFDLWDAWLILEEASAETIVHDFLIPWFTPRLIGRLRTLSAAGAHRVAPTFDDFHRLVLFTHLESAYHDRAWVLVDGGDLGEGIVADLRAKYTSWTPDRFLALNAHAFEHYYPDRFAEERTVALGEQDRKRRRDAKHRLLQTVRDWCVSEPEQAKSAFEESAEEVIGFLRRIEAALDG